MTCIWLVCCLKVVYGHANMLHSAIDFHVFNSCPFSEVMPGRAISNRSVASLLFHAKIFQLQPQTYSRKYIKFSEPFRPEIWTLGGARRVSFWIPSYDRATNRLTEHGMIFTDAVIKTEWWTNLVLMARAAAKKSRFNHASGPCWFSYRHPSHVLRIQRFFGCRR